MNESPRQTLAGHGGARWWDLAREAFKHVRAHPLRSLLTALTSAVAIAVTVNVISLSYGLDEDVRRDVSRFGLTTVDVGRMPIVAPGTPRVALGPPDMLRVRELLAGLPCAVVPRRQVAGTLERVLPPTGDGARAPGAAEPAAVGASLPLRIQCLATSPDYLRTLSIQPEVGRWLRPDDAGRDVCVLDSALARRLLAPEPPAAALGRRLRVALPGGTRELEVVGVLEDPLTYRDLFDAFDEGSSARTLTSSLLSFRNLYLPERALGEGDLSGISVVFDDPADVDEGARRLTGVWPRMSLDPSAFGMTPIGVFVRRDWVLEMGGSTAMGTLVGNVVWLLVVLVAAAMLATLHLITVRERYDELAVRRCEGARRSDLAWQITLEGTLTALAGGLLGLPLGSAAASVLRRIVDVPFRFEARYALAATGVAVLLGLLASVLPALRAARLDPARILTRRLT